MSFKTNPYTLGKNLYASFKTFLEGNLINTYPQLKIVTSSNVSSYPSVIFNEGRNNITNRTTRMELRKRNVEFEINIYAIDFGDKTADEIINDISSCALYYLEKILNVETDTTRMNDFDNKGTQNRRLLIRFDINWLQDKNIIK